MNVIKSLIVVVVVLFSAVAESAMVNVRIVKGGVVGLDDATIPSQYGGPYSYFAGIVTLDINGVNYQAVNISSNSFLGSAFWPSYNSGSQQLKLSVYKYDDIVGGATKNIHILLVNNNFLLTPAKFSEASWFLQNGMLGYDPADPQWTASFDEMVWKTFTGQDIWGYSDRLYANSINSSLTLHDTYDMAVATKISPTADYNNFMFFVGGDYMPGFLVYKNPGQGNPPTVPLPPAIWLFGTGLVGLVGIARRKK